MTMYKFNQADEKNCKLSQMYPSAAAKAYIRQNGMSNFLCVEQHEKNT